jgi:hypothetical protein
VGIGQSSITRAFTNYNQVNISGSSGATIQMQVGSTANTNIVSDGNALYIAQLAGNMQFGVGGTGTGTNRMTIASDGVITSPLGGMQVISGTAVASTSGTSIDFTGIPSWVKRITVMFSNVSTNGVSNMQVQIGTSGGVQTTGYLGSYGYGQIPSFNITTGFGIYFDSAGDLVQGSLTLNLLSSATGIWTYNSLLSWSTRAYQLPGSGSKTLSGTLDRVRITTITGVNTFDSGTINILYE